MRFPVAIALKAAITAASIEWPQQLLAILLALAVYGTLHVGPDDSGGPGHCIFIR